jgi:hypothetical protein
MAITQAFANSFKSQVLQGDQDLTADTLKMALYTSSASLGPDTTVYSTTNEVTGTGYTAGGKTLTITQTPTSSGTPSTTAYINFADINWTGASFSADGALIYNSTNGNKSVAVLNFGATKTVSSGTFTIVFPPAGTGSAIVQIQ